MNLSSFGMDTVSMTGGLAARLHATCDAGFSQIMLWAADLAGHPDGMQEAVRLVRASGLRVTGLQVLRDVEGQDAPLRNFKLAMAGGLLHLCGAVGAPLLLVCSNTAPHASGAPDVLARDLTQLATLAEPLGVKIAYEALSWGRHVNQPAQAWDVVEMSGHANLGLVIDAFHVLARAADLHCLNDIPSHKIFLVQLSDFLLPTLNTDDYRLHTARHGRVFPGAGSHSDELADLLLRLDHGGYRGDYSFEVANDDYLQLPPAVVAGYAYRSARWVIDQALRRSPDVRRSTAGHSSML
ncbi:MAG: sugar phosphate isomerase/epimerase [Pseudomonadota bacterium]|nr:sugar phosphate isomerase/epimerase [Pseudomonadota bacterium]